MKYEWRKEDKKIYLPKGIELIELEPMQYLVIEGRGNPNSEGFSKCVEALYALSYGIKMSPKKGIITEGYFDYTVFPLEGIWDLTDEGKSLYANGVPVIELKDELLFKVMIRQPDFVTNDLLEQVKPNIKKKIEYMNDVKLETLKEGRALQMIHLGSYDDEPASFAKLETYCHDEGFHRKDRKHKEIYLSDPRKVSEDKLKTTLRIWID